MSRLFGRWPVIQVLALTAVLLASFPGRAYATHWQMFKDPPLTVRYHQDAENLALQIMERASTYLQDISRVLQLPAEGPYVIILAQSREEFKSLQPTSTPGPEWAGALTYPELGVVLLMTPGALGDSGRGYWSLLHHEMVHLIMGQAEYGQGGKVPRWLSEGVATYISGEMGLVRLMHLSWARLTGRAVPFDKLTVRFPENPSLAEAAYAQSYLFVQYVMRSFGSGGVGRLVAAVTAEPDMEKAVFSAFGISLEELMAGFQDYVKVKATWIPVITSSATLWGAITLLFLVTYSRRKILDMRRLREWDEEDIEDSRGVRTGDGTGEKKNPTVH